MQLVQQRRRAARHFWLCGYSALHLEWDPESQIARPKLPSER